MKLAYFDVHSHLNLAPLFERAGEIVEEMKHKAVGTITVGVDIETSKQSIELAEKYENIWACIGMHPVDNQTEEFNIEAYKELAQNKKVVAIGECGLDYFRGKDEAMIARQKELFIKQIELSLEVNKPLMIHARPSKGSMDAYEDVLTILEKYEGVKANFHFFVGDTVIAQRALLIGSTFSFDGPITFSKDYDEVIKMIPLQAIMLETDAPFAAPEPYRSNPPKDGRGKCEPWMVEEMYKKVAELKELPLEVVQKEVQANVERVFGIKTNEE